MAKPKPKSDPEPINPVRKRLPTSSSPWPEDLVQHLRALTRFILVQTEEEHLLLETFSRMMLKYRDRTWVFDAEHGLKLITPYLQQVTNGTCTEPPCQVSPNSVGRCVARFERIQKHYPPAVAAQAARTTHTAMNEIVSHDPKCWDNFYIILDSEMWFYDSLMLRRLINLALSLQADPSVVKCLLFVGHPSMAVPPKLAKYLSPVAYGLEEASVKKRLEEAVLKTLGLLRVKPPAVDFGKLFSGLTCYESEEITTQAVTQSLILNGRPPRETLDLDLVLLKRLIEARRKIRSKL